MGLEAREAPIRASTDSWRRFSRMVAVRFHGSDCHRIAGPAAMDPGCGRVDMRGKRFSRLETLFRTAGLYGMEGWSFDRLAMTPKS
jgi:hypothetical protein